jgi:hypothetical protein
LVSLVGQGSRGQGLRTISGHSSGSLNVLCCADIGLSLHQLRRLLHVMGHCLSRHCGGKLSRTASCGGRIDNQLRCVSHLHRSLGQRLISCHRDSFQRHRDGFRDNGCRRSSVTRIGRLRRPQPGDGLRADV